VYLVEIICNRTLYGVVLQYKCLSWVQRHLMVLYVLCCTGAWVLHHFMVLYCGTSAWMQCHFMVLYYVVQVLENNSSLWYCIMVQVLIWVQQHLIWCCARVQVLVWENKLEICTIQSIIREYQSVSLIV
jgi:hypothetical protein